MSSIKSSREKKQQVTITPDWPLKATHVSPAESVGAAGTSQLQAAGFVPLLVRAGGDDGAAAALGARLVRTRAEQQRVTQLP